MGTAPLRVLHHGEFAVGRNDHQRHRALAARQDVICVSHPLVDEALAGKTPSLYARMRWRLREPIDFWHENARLLDASRRFRPDIVLVENSKVLARSTLAALRQISDPVIAYLSSDDIMAKHNLSLPLKRSLPDWDLVFTTKSFNVPELSAAGVNEPVLLTNMFDPLDHHPMNPAAVGEEFEAFDLVFVGTFERERAHSLNRLAKAGFSIAVFGNPAGMIEGGWSTELHPSISRRPAAFGLEYSRAMHLGKVVLGYLRKVNRDQITTRSMEIPAARRCLLAERTIEHDAHFVEGVEYVGFADDDTMIAAARLLLADDVKRKAIAEAGYKRCFASGYTVADQIDRILTECQRKLSAKRRATASAAE